MPDPLPLDQLIGLDPLLTDEERMIRDTVRRFVRERYLPRAGELFAQEKFATDLIPEIARMGLLGATLHGYGCAGMSSVSYGLALQELEAWDSGLRSFVSVQGSLAMWPIWKYGSEEQKERFLPKMAAAELIGCFGLTEPDSGSDPGSMTTRARTDGDGYVLSGTKMWITSAPVADLAVVWAKVDDGDASSIRGFSVEGLKGPLGCLTQARFGISWGALGAARACYDAAVSYARERVQFGKPIASKQLVQEQLVEMAMEIAKGQIMAL